MSSFGNIILMFCCKSYSGIMLYCGLIFKHLLIFGDQNEHSVLIKRKQTSHLYCTLSIKRDNICQKHCTLWSACSHSWGFQSLLTVQPKMSHSQRRWEICPWKLWVNKCKAGRRIPVGCWEVTSILAGDPDGEWSTFVVSCILQGLAKHRAKGASCILEEVPYNYAAALMLFYDS